MKGHKGKSDKSMRNPSKNRGINANGSQQKGGGSSGKSKSKKY